jgi:CAAX protease family protein
MSTPEPARVIAPVARPLPRSVAPPWHTVLMTLLVMGPLIQAKLYDLRHPGATLQGPPAPQIYIIGAIVQCIFCLFAWWGLRLGHVSLQGVIGGRWNTWRDVARDVGTAFLFWAFWYIALTIVKTALTAAGVNNTGAAGMVYPAGTLEVLLWILNAALAGFVEELVFRGYFMNQFIAWTRSTVAAVLLQGVLFGVAHAYLLGIRQVVVIATSGILIGILTSWQRNLRPAMIFHSWADIFGAIIVRGLPFQ